jgi:hypothetical protein
MVNCVVDVVASMDASGAQKPQHGSTSAGPSVAVVSLSSFPPAGTAVAGIAATSCGTGRFLPDH